MTKEKLSSIFKENNFSEPKVVEESSDDATTVYVGTDGSDGPAEVNGEKLDMDFNQIDAYQLDISDDAITVIGKETDVAFYGVSSLEKYLDQSQDNNVQNLEIKDYANTEIRGFIEGFYGIPWSNDDRKSLMEFGGQFKTYQEDDQINKNAAKNLINHADQLIENWE